MDVTISELRSFVALADLGSFADAAGALGVSQPALTRRIQKFEESLGVQMFDRTTRRLSLSTVGRDFLPRARRILNDLDASLMNMPSIAERMSGQVNIACVPTVATHVLPRVISLFSAEFPRVRVRIIDEVANRVLQAVLDGEADIGISLGDQHEPQIEFERMFDDPFVLVCRRDHPLAAKSEVAWPDLQGHAFIRAGQMNGNRAVIDAVLQGATSPPAWLYEVQHLTTSLGLVEAGLGVAAFPKMAMPQAEHPMLTSRPLVSPTFNRTIGIVRRRGAVLSPFTQALLDKLRLGGGTMKEPVSEVPLEEPETHYLAT